MIYLEHLNDDIVNAVCPHRGDKPHQDHHLRLDNDEWKCKHCHYSVGDLDLKKKIAALRKRLMAIIQVDLIDYKQHNPIKKFRGVFLFI